MKKLQIYKLIFVFSLTLMSSNILISQQADINFKEVEAKIIDSETKKSLVFTSIVIQGSNISTVSNGDGEFLLKIPNSLIESNVVITHLGYEDKILKVSSLKNNVKILLKPATTQLKEVSITTSSKNAKEIVQETLKKKSSIYNNDRTLMTAFYRETIKKRRKNAFSFYYLALYFLLPLFQQ